MAQISGDHGFLAFYSFSHVKSCRDSEKRKKIPQIIGHARAPATEGSYPLRHNFAEELGSNGPENTAWQQLKQSQSGVMKDNVHRGCQESKTARLHLLLPVIPQEGQRIPRLKSTPPVSCWLVPIRRTTQRLRRASS